MCIRDSGSANNGDITFVLKHLWVSEVIVEATFGKSLLTGPIDYLSFCYLNTDCYSSVNGEYTLLGNICLLYTSDAADDLLCVDLGGRRIIQKNKKKPQNFI